MLNSNSKIKKSAVSALMCFAVLFTALNLGCCLCNSAVAVGDPAAEPEDDFLFWDTYAYSAPSGENEQEQIFYEDKLREPKIPSLKTATFIETARYNKYLSGNCSPQ